MVVVSVAGVNGHRRRRRYCARICMRGLRMQMRGAPESSAAAARQQRRVLRAVNDCHILDRCFMVICYMA